MACLCDTIFRRGADNTHACHNDPGRSPGDQVLHGRQMTEGGRDDLADCTGASSSWGWVSLNDRETSGAYSRARSTSFPSRKRPPIHIEFDQPSAYLCLSSSSTQCEPLRRSYDKSPCPITTRAPSPPLSIALSCGHGHCSLPNAYWIIAACDRCLYIEHAISTLIGKFRLFRYECAWWRPGTGFPPPKQISRPRRYPARLFYYR